MKLVLEKMPWHTCHDRTPRYKYDSVLTVYGVTIRTCRLSKDQVRKLRWAGVEVVNVKCIHCKRHRCVCLKDLEPESPRYRPHERKRT